MAETIHYEWLGKGKETILLINGLARSSRHWLGFPDLLVQKGYRVLLVDNRGFGRSRNIPLHLRSSVHDFALDVQAVLEKERVSAVHVVGLSLGGMIAMQLAALIPEVVRSLTVVNSSAGGTLRPRLSIRGGVNLVLMGAKKSPKSRSLVELSSLTTLRPDDEHFGEILDKLVAIEKKEPVYVPYVTLQLGAALRFSIKDIEPYITCPVLIIYSDRDQFVPAVNSLELQKHLAAQSMRCIKGAGHEVMIEKPQEVATLVHEHVSSVQ